MAERHGLVLVHTGKGKGKTTAALGMGLRAWGQGMRVLVVQFIKGGWKYGELAAIAKLGPDFVIRQMGEGFVQRSPKTEDQKEQHRLAAAEALAAAQTAIASAEWDMIILDEINYAVHFGLISEEDVLALLASKPADLHLVLTGREAKPAVIEQADLVTEMQEVKHPYKQGIKAQCGIEF